MNKQEFLRALRKKLSDLPKKDADERIAFYGEMIDDGIEEGLSEEEAVEQIGSVEEIAAQIVSEISPSSIAKRKFKPQRRLKAWEIVLLTIGSPIWLSLFIAAFAVVFTAYVVVWSACIALRAIFVAFIACAAGGAICGIIFAIGENKLSGLAAFGTALVLAGLAIFLFYGCKITTRLSLSLPKNISSSIKNRSVKKEESYE